MAPAEQQRLEEAPLLCLPGLAPAEASRRLLEAKEAGEAAQYEGLDLSLLDGELHEELVGQAIEFCKAAGSSGAMLRLAHDDLGSGTDCEQRLFDIKAEREVLTSQRAVHVKKKSKSANEKDFAAAAEMRRTANAGIEAADQRLAEIDQEFAELDRRQKQTSWFSLFSQLQAQSRNNVRRLDLTNCGLHATGVSLLQQVLLDLEHRGDGLAVEELVLDGNDLGDSSTVALASLVRLSSCLVVLRLRNIGVSDGGLSQILSGLVANKSLALLDLRGNGLCSPEISKAATDGFRRFNKTAQILLE